MSEAVNATLNIAQMLPGAFFEEHRDEIAAAMLRVLDSGWYILGAEVRAFEEEFAGHFGFGGAVGAASGTDAIVLALRSLGIGRGDRVATVSHTAVATIAAIELTGASVVFVDICPDTYVMDPESLSGAVINIDSIKAVIPVHIYGHPADMQAINEIARQHGVYVIEDCSQAHGTKLGACFAGEMSDLATFSFYPTKNLGAVGDGGMVVSRNPENLKRVQSLREYGWERRFISETPGMNSRLDELQAAILRARLPYLTAGNARRRQIAAAYDRGLAGLGLILPIEKPCAFHTYHQYVVRHADRDGLQARLREVGIGSSIHYPMPVHRQPAYRERCRMAPAGLGATDSAAGQILSLPMYPELSDAAIASVIHAVRVSA